MYTAKLKVLGKIHTGTGKTVEDAIASLKPENVAGLCILTVTNNDSKIERILSTQLAKRAFNLSGMTREVALKNISLMFK